MSELMVLLQALLLMAGWLLFLRAQTELRAQAARQSLTGELEELRQTIDALLHKLAEDAARAEARLETRLRELERYAAQPTEPAPLIPAALPKSVDAHASNPPSPQPSPPLTRGERAGSGGILHAQEFVNSGSAIGITSPTLACLFHNTFWLVSRLTLHGTYTNRKGRVYNCPPP